MLIKRNNIFSSVLGLCMFAFSSHLLAAEEGDISRGSVAWANNCARCHNMRDPKEFRDDQWRPIVTHMRLRAGLSGQQERDILAFLQSSNYTPVVVAAAGDGEDSAESSSLTGEQIYQQTCVACHGANGQGAIPGVPKLSDRLSKTDETLLNHMTNGFQSKGSPMAMPAKGGNPGLTDADMKEVLSYLRKSFGK